MPCFEANILPLPLAPKSWQAVRRQALEPWRDWRGTDRDIAASVQSSAPQTMKNKSSKQPKNTKSAARVKDLRPRKDPKAAARNQPSGTALASVTDLVIDPFNPNR